ncbi:hypothetical protein OG413_38040 [Streptomyces sp. NBC_01433]|uniref:hypothetical protein n=1 Tax=Streptomyces sp. NBC_01433 TaxID=2903864 RepID=UPI00225AC1F9|nr:hypothetical protein [Streptomyces sp. NBC_01433]MCX4681015.1 hypothetical protein [Streptomyces sp. NBC_01433]
MTTLPKPRVPDPSNPRTRCAGRPPEPARSYRAGGTCTETFNTGVSGPALGTGQGLLTNPAAGGSVSFRADGIDRKSATFSQTVIDAYRTK